MRLDFKLNLLLDLAGQLLAASQPRLRPFTIRFNAMGATCHIRRNAGEGAHGILEIMLRDIIVQPLQSAGASRVGRAARAKRACVFSALGETVADHIEKLVFRRHRRKIAGARSNSRATKNSEQDSH